MPRPKTQRSSSDIAAEIRRLEQEKKRLILAEDQQRGSIIRDCLNGPAGESLKSLLRSAIPSRYAALFGLDPSDCRPDEKPTSGKTRAATAAALRPQRMSTDHPAQASA